MAAPKKDEIKNDDMSSIFDQPPKGLALMCEESKAILNDPTVVCQIRRSKNDNRVMYRAKLIDDPSNSGKKMLDPKEPIQVFWLKIEPSYIEKHRKSGKKDDQTDLTFLESNMAFGISWEVYGDAKNNEFKLTFVALKDRPCILKMDPKDNAPKCFGSVENASGKSVNAILTGMYVHTTENWVGLPTVNYILLNGNEYDTGKQIQEKLLR
eukprot:CAMPEP_0202704196 /NCGR_PEP_ID=MMETSP1385-20130828/16920_1 /ASSEMBLY_ACC=CAM_ASM_000861 /TAXON_ID=933848 /ORGANISM="Elphidium margaritaceum" /LENGTH=209 /DNA_ID=CAMNT_0049362167 /DNA_START=42 /DNA_END=671 /DNA_ORIENTATION=-